MTPRRRKPPPEPHESVRVRWTVWRRLPDGPLTLFGRYPNRRTAQRAAEALIEAGAAEVHVCQPGVLPIPKWPA